MSGDAILGGFYRLDGEKLSKIRLSDSPDYIFDFLIDNENTAWFNTVDGLAYFRDGKWYYKDTSALNRCEFGLDSDDDAILSMCFDSNYNLWSYKRNDKKKEITLSCDNTNEHKEYKKSVSGYVQKMLVDNNNNIYFFQFDLTDKIYRFANEKWDSLNIPDVLIGIKKNRFDRDTSREKLYDIKIALDGKNNLLIKTSKGVGMFDGTNWSIKESNLPDIQLPHLYIKNNLSSNTKCYYIFENDTSNLLTDYYKSEKIPVPKTYIKYISRGVKINNDNLLLWGIGKGIYIYNPESKEINKIPDINIEDAIMDINGELFFNSDKGLIMFDGNVFLIFKKINLKNQVFYGFDLKNNLWFGANGQAGVFHEGGIMF
jgi:hypothetical protein